MTARHKLLLCCVLIAIRPPFLFIKLFCRQDGGIVTSNLSIPTTFSKAPQPPRPALNLPPLSKVRCCRPKKFWRLPEGLLYTHQPLHPHNPLKSTSPPHHTCLKTTFFSLQKQLYPFSRLFNCPNLFRTSLTSPRPRAILLLVLAKTNLI